MRILLVFDSLSPIGGGSQTACISWYKNLKKMGCNVKILCNKNALQFLNELSAKDIIGLPFVNLHVLFPKYYPNLFLTETIKEEILSFAPDVVHIQEPGLLTKKIISFAKSKHIPTLFSYNTDYTKQFIAQFPLSLTVGKNGIVTKFFSSFSNNLYQQVDGLTVPTQYYQSMLERKFDKPIFLLPLPIGVSFYKKRRVINKIPKKLIAVSRLSGGKNIAFLLRIMQQIKSGFLLHIVGDGPDRAFLQKKVKQSHLEKRVRFTGWLAKKDLIAQFLSSDLFVSPSDSETFGITYLEALASGLPCIVYDYPVAREIIPAKTAVFITSFAPTIWAKALMRLQKNPQEYVSLQKGIKAEYEKISVYNEKNSTNTLIGIYEKLLKGKRNGISG